MKNESFIIPMLLGDNSSEYVLGPTSGLELRRFVTQGSPLYIIDEVVAEKHPRWLEQIQESCTHSEHKVLLLPGGENIKSLARLEEIYGWLASLNVPRDSTLVAFGGGTILDLAGFAASTWRRGMNFVAIPTTLLAMVDAAIGGKTAINTAGQKNPVGTFHPASGILAEPGFLSTLSCSCWQDGLAEIIKTAIIGDASLFATMYRQRDNLKELLKNKDPEQPVAGILGAIDWKNWIARAATVKSRIVEADFRESGQRRALNLGHTLGHALETHALEVDQPLSHGHAVSIGLAVVTRIAGDRGTLDLPVAVQIIELLEACGLPVSMPAPSSVILGKLLGSDKKNSSSSGLKWVLPEALGQVNIEETISIPELLKWLD